MQYTIDRFEGNFAVVELENETFVNIPRSAIPSEAKEGDVITVMVDKGETEKREKRIKELEDSLFVD
ncbi:MAG: DUF3006 domain-containing protein [Thermocaproicibacter melissae]|jgi:hypothetical protein|uniref:DUF3006 domain-containing protein n=1 Tax=Thermocaproicibacter melissae TaxID=2966552 RepID=UPI0024B120BC|nr:DUF3006 domain-containing protein [Thermocaproicibacter melissae]WBY64606.1 DUF3006 domain-containing protein [Thermocaproicibacter melissae]